MGDKKRVDWEDSPSTDTPITAAELERMESRVRDLRWDCPAAWTSIDEFDDDSISGTAVRVDPSGGSSRMALSEASDTLSVANIGGDSSAQLHALLYPLSSFGGSLSVGDGIVSCYRFINDTHSAVNFSMNGVVFADGTTHGSGKQVGALSYTSNSGLWSTEQVWSWTNFNTTVSQDAGIAGPIGPWMYHRLALVATNSWRHDLSLDGTLWWPTSSGLSYSMTPTHVGILSSSWGTSTKSHASYEFLRRVSGVS